MAKVDLNIPPSLIALVAGNSFKESQTLRFRCHGRLFENASLAYENGTELLHVESKYRQSWSFRRSSFDAAENHILDLRHYSLDIEDR